jgi:hypothetical protein
MDVVLVPASGATVSNLFARISTAPAAGASYTITVMDNGVDTSVTCTISALTTCSNTTDSVSVDPGHYLQVKVTQTLGATSNRMYGVSFRF